MKKQVPEGTRVTAGGECNLVADDYSTKQYFAGDAKVVWRAQPKITSINTAKGPTQLNIGTIWFDVEGMPGKENIPSEMAVITNSP